jgi:xylulokinase
MEGITLNLRVILEAFRRQGARVEALRVIGGGARSSEWNAIMADIFGLPVLRLALLEEATSMGAAVAGGVGVGIWKDFSQVDTMVAVQSESRPDPQRHEFYSEVYDIFNDLYDVLDRGSIFERLTALKDS